MSRSTRGKGVYRVRRRRRNAAPWYRVHGLFNVELVRSGYLQKKSEFAFLDMNNDFGFTSLSLNPLSEEVLLPLSLYRRTQKGRLPSSLTMATHWIRNWVPIIIFPTSFPSTTFTQRMDPTVRVSAPVNSRQAESFLHRLHRLRVLSAYGNGVIQDNNQHVPNSFRWLSE